MAAGLYVCVVDRQRRPGFRGPGFGDKKSVIMATRTKKATKDNAERVKGFYNRALELQWEMYDFAEELAKMGREDLAQLLSNGAFEMDLTCENAGKVAKKLMTTRICDPDTRKNSA